MSELFDRARRGGRRAKDQKEEPQVAADSTGRASTGEDGPIGESPEAAPSSFHNPFEVRGVSGLTATVGLRSDGVEVEGDYQGVAVLGGAEFVKLATTRRIGERSSRWPTRASVLLIPLADVEYIGLGVERPQVRNRS